MAPRRDDLRTVFLQCRTTPAIKELVENKARQLRMSMSNYIEMLVEIDCDVRQKTREPPGREVFAFNGNVVRVTQQQIDSWKARFSNVPDIGIALNYADEWLTEHPHLIPKWRTMVEKYLEQENSPAPQPPASEELPTC